MLALVLTLAILACFVPASANYRYSRTYQTGNALPLTELEAFVNSLPKSGVQSIRVTGSDGTDFTCATPSTAQAIVNQWGVFGTYPSGGWTNDCGGQRWYTSGCCGYTIEIGGPFLCACQQLWSIRSGAGCSWGTNWGGTSCPGRGPLTLTIEVVTCGPVFQQTDLCNGGEGCSQCNCIAGYTPYSPTQPACKRVDMCAVYGYSGQNVNFVSGCFNNAPNQRTITCKEGYYIVGYPQTTTQVILTGGTAFSGCTQQDMCGLYGYNGLTQNTKSCVTNAPNQRTITCSDGFYAQAPNNPSITLTGNAAFQGCKQIDNCAVYGYNGLTNFVLGCSNGVNTRTITCQPGYAAQGQASNPSVTLTGSQAFTGCALIDTCAIFGLSGHPQHVLSCKSYVNYRVITCEEGYYPIGTTMTLDSDNITLTGATLFAGCEEENLCTLEGYSGHDANALSCVAGPNQRTITCKPGFHALGSTPETNPVITLRGENAPFAGCEQIDNCKVYGYNGNQQFAKSCVNGVNTRTITCTDGYYLTGTQNTQAPPTTFVTLTAGASFVGCSLIDNCKIYGNSGKPDHVINCVNGINTRNVSCAYGYYAVDGAVQYQNAIPWILLTGNTAFKGCDLVPTCILYGYSNHAEHAASCEQNGPGVRIITCNAGYYAIAPATPKVSLNGNAAFTGCFQIDNCAVYGNSGKPLGVESCVNGVNIRTMTCLRGYSAIAPTTRAITLTGNTAFAGCTQIDMCAVYGYKNKPKEVFGCVNAGVNLRTVTCNKHYAILTISGGGGTRTIETYDSNVTLEGPVDFPGCVPWCGDGYKLPEEQCEDGNLDEDDGCDGICEVQPGWTCSDHLVGKCCRIVDSDIVNKQGLVCKNGAFAPKKPGVPITIAGPPQTLYQNLTICGDLVIGYADDRVALIEVEYRSPNLMLSHDVVLTVAGTVKIDQTGVVGFAPGSIINVIPYCDTDVPYDETKQLNLVKTSLLQLYRTVESGRPDFYISAPDAVTPWEPLGPFINISGCGTFNRFSFYVESQGYFTEGDFPLISSQCADAIPDPVDENNQPTGILYQYDYWLNITCPKFYAWSDIVLGTKSIRIGIDVPNLCTPQIIGIAVGTIVGGLLLLALLALLGYFLMAAPAASTGAEGGGYVAM